MTHRLNQLTPAPTALDTTTRTRRCSRRIHGRACFCDVAEDFDVPQPSLSHHLRVLASPGTSRHLELVPAGPCPLRNAQAAANAGIGTAPVQHSNPLRGAH
ncbi:helix-turn-helix domain-containing protein [Amycolatopsis sp. NPDC005003]